MKVIDAQVHIWSQTVIPPGGGHRQVSSLTAEQLLAEMDEAGVDAGLIHPPASWDPTSNALAIEAAKKAISCPLMEAGGVKGGVTYGASDEWSFRAAEKTEPFSPGSWGVSWA